MSFHRTNESVPTAFFLHKLDMLDMYIKTEVTMQPIWQILQREELKNVIPCIYLTANSLFP